MSWEAVVRTLQYPIPAKHALEPPQEWAELREQCPVAPVRFPSGDEAVLVTRYDDVKLVLSDPRFVRNFSADDAASIAEGDSGGVFESEMAASIEGAGHQRWRRMIARWFTARRMLALHDDIEAMADRMIDDMVAAGGPADLKAALGFPLPVWVICDMLGVSESDRDRFAHWSNALLNLSRFTKEEVALAQREFGEYMAALVAQKRAAPGNDLISDLISRTDDDGATLTDAELIATGQALLVAGHETTANMIGKMMGMLLADRSRWEQLVADRSLARTAVEEVLRFDANPGFGMPRYLTEDAEVAGTMIPRGTTMVCSMAAANRDERVFDDPEEMDLSRSPNHHLSFGAGPHSCLGQALARTELRTVLEVLLRRLPTLELAVAPEELRRIEGLAVGGVEELPVRW
ncbi:MAG: cytochrome [Pseudonocardia sp.]|nr:cytochrome [Pseudonocardia sp.]